MIVFPLALLHRVVEVVRQVEVGELLCGSLKDAPDSTLLRFAISSTEVRGEAYGIGRAISYTLKCQGYPSLESSAFNRVGMLVDERKSPLEYAMDAPSVYFLLRISPRLTVRLPIHAIEKAIVRPIATEAVQICRLDEPQPSTRIAAFYAYDQAFVVDAAFRLWWTARTSLAGLAFHVVCGSTDGRI